MLPMLNRLEIICTVRILCYLGRLQWGNKLNLHRTNKSIATPATRAVCWPELYRHILRGICRYPLLTRFNVSGSSEMRFHAVIGSDIISHRQKISSRS
jgi:hypothetical protein